MTYVTVDDWTTGAEGDGYTACLRQFICIISRRKRGKSGPRGEGGRVQVAGLLVQTRCRREDEKAISYFFSLEKGKKKKEGKGIEVPRVKPIARRCRGKR